jgi:hypothetical protein
LIASDYLFPKQFSRAKKLVACLLLTCLGACGGAPELEWKDIIRDDKSDEVYTPPDTSDHLVVYLDTSASMEGYISPDRKRTAFGAQDDSHTVFTHTLRALRDEAITSFNPRLNVVYRQVASKVSDPVFSDLRLAEAATTRSLYRDGETNLAGAVSLFAETLPSQSRPAQGAGGEAPRPALFHVLVTDGVQSTKQQRTDVKCMSGSDYACVQNAVRTLIAAGWAGSVLGVKSEFHGNVYSEVRPGNRPSEHNSASGDVGTFRPFYLYVFSPNREALDKLVEALKARIKQIKALKGHDDAVREYALTSAYANDSTGAEIVIPKESSDYLERTRSRDGEKPARLTLKVDVDTERRGPQPFSIMLNVPWSSHAKDSAAPEALQGLLKWDLVPVNPKAGEEQKGVRYPEVKLAGTRAAPDGRVELQATAHWPAGTGETRWRAYRLEGKLNLDQRAPPWVGQWSTNTDETQATATQTFNLESSFANLWRNPILEKQLVAEVYLRVGTQ